MKMPKMTLLLAGALAAVGAQAFTFKAETAEYKSKYGVNRYSHAGIAGVAMGTP